MNSGLHDKRCLARSLMATIENMRDDEDTELVWFREAMVNGQLLEIAEGYLEDGLMECVCKDRDKWTPATRRLEAVFLPNHHYFTGTITDPQGQLRWECEHLHQLEPQALACARDAFAFSWNKYDPDDSDGSDESDEDVPFTIGEPRDETEA